MKDQKKVGAPFPNASEMVRVVYDFAVDGGAIGDLAALVATDKVVVSLKHAHVLAAVTSEGAITVSLGSEATGDEFMDGTLKAALGIGVVLAGEGGRVLLAVGEKIELALGVADATAGKIEFVFEVTKAN